MLHFKEVRTGDVFKWIETNALKQGEDRGDQKGG
jgi:hypothetical protein